MSNARSQAGFTLLEMVLASGIFALVMLASFVVVGNTQRLAGRTATQRSVEQAGRFSLESMAREVRLANGLLTQASDGEITTDATPFGLLDANGFAVPAGVTVQQSGSGIEIRETDLTNNATKTIKQIRLFPKNPTTGSPAYIGVSRCLSVSGASCTQYAPPVAITPNDVSVTDVQFSGVAGCAPTTAAACVQFAAAPRQPYVEIKLTLSSVNQTASMPATTATVQTLVTVRNY